MARRRRSSNCMPMIAPIHPSVSVMIGARLSMIGASSRPIHRPDENAEQQIFGTGDDEKAPCQPFERDVRGEISPGHDQEQGERRGHPSNLNRCRANATCRLCGRGSRSTVNHGEAEPWCMAQHAAPNRRVPHRRRRPLGGGSGMRTFAARAARSTVADASVGAHRRGAQRASRYRASVRALRHRRVRER